ncbi:hypothetical protein [Chryseobacterium sp. FH1]|uniref:hypothetical protein n=1 Tax=Chryseobacterium sp. FH1 TaxID=1233951 RepID=UPI0004E2C7E3|nr:hypothetical protein [Chryseobacterium sp. FH1]KFC19513.1 hypothetical protein IO90_09485 [Chryseobacterium sp. FH1]
MRKTSIKIALYGLLSVMTFGTVITSCSNDDDDIMEETVGQGSHYKITVTLDNVNPDDDYVSVVVAGGTGSGKTDVWKVNGVVKTGESAIGLGDNDFAGSTKTYVIETTEPIAAFSGGVQIINYGAPLPVKYKIEKGNETVVNENVTLTGDGADLTKQYSF